MSKLIRPGLFTAALTLVTGMAMAQPAFWTREWPVTDFSKKSVEFIEIMGGGPPKDGIPSVDNPRFIPVSEETSLVPTEPVSVIEFEGETPRAYPYRYLMWHEIVNDVVGGVPIAVTYCPLCATIITFERTLNGKVTTFGTTGKLRLSNLIMYDRETESWWQQAEGKAIVGELTGQTLTPVISWTESWAEFKERNPDGLVMDSPRAGRPYGRNPYAGYDTAAKPFLYNGENPPFGISPLARVVQVGSRAWPLERLMDAETLTEAGVTISWKAGQNSALDSGSIPKGRDIGMIRVKDAATGKDVLHDVIFAFVFQAFEPDGEWMIGGG
jgi:uncharacterized protein DUF3179